jgi:hypothetical protein
MPGGVGVDVCRIMRKRRDLRLVVSSATMDAEAFATFFEMDPDIDVTVESDARTTTIISVDGRQYPVGTLTTLCIVHRPACDHDFALCMVATHSFVRLFGLYLFLLRFLSPTLPWLVLTTALMHATRAFFFCRDITLQTSCTLTIHAAIMSTLLSRRPWLCTVVLGRVTFWYF